MTCTSLHSEGTPSVSEYALLHLELRPGGISQVLKMFHDAQLSIRCGTIIDGGKRCDELGPVFRASRLYRCEPEIATGDIREKLDALPVANIQNARDCHSHRQTPSIHWQVSHNLQNILQCPATPYHHKQTRNGESAMCAQQHTTLPQKLLPLNALFLFCEIDKARISFPHHASQVTPNQNNWNGDSGHRSGERRHTADGRRPEGRTTESLNRNHTGGRDQIHWKAGCQRVGRRWQPVIHWAGKQERKWLSAESQAQVQNKYLSVRNQ